MNCVNPTNMVCYEYADGSRRLISEQAACSQSWRSSIFHTVVGRDLRHQYYRRSDGKPLNVFPVRCGRCLLCRQSRGFEVGIRARCEAACYGAADSCFITLTVSDENMSRVFPGEVLRHEPWQLFAKRLRKRIGPFRFLMCGEYGDNTKRPHYHAIIFGHDFYSTDVVSFTDRCFQPGKLVIKSLARHRNERNFTRHSIDVLRDAWSLDGVPIGHVKCGRLNENRIMYVAGYVLKPGIDDDMDIHDSVVLEHFTGFRSRNYVKWSRCPGLGGNWLDKFHESVYRYEGKDFEFGTELDRVVSAVVWNRKLVPFACRYFDERLALLNPRKYDKLKVFRTEVGSLKGTLARSVRLREFELVGLKNKLEVLAKKVASRKRDFT